MNSFFGVILFLTANLMLATSLETRTVFGNRDMLDMVPLPPMLAGPNMTLPGTKWCGIGVGSATDFSDLGFFNKTDMCCRDHQLCEEIIEPVATLYSLENPALLPKFNCKCEERLFRCLKQQDDFPSAVFGEAYFSLMDQCFAEDHPTVKCVKFQTAAFGIGKRCVEYQLDETKEKMYQFFDLPFYTMKLNN